MGFTLHLAAFGPLIWWQTCQVATVNIKVTRYIGENENNPCGETEGGTNPGGVKQWLALLQQV